MIQALLLILSFVLLVIGMLLSFWGGFALAGGPDGKILSSESIMFGSAFLLIGGLFLFGSSKIVPMGYGAYLPVAVSLVCFPIVAVLPEIGLSLIPNMTYVIVCAIGILGYWVYRVIKKSKS